MKNVEKVPMQFPYGAVYFRKSNPPKQDWERDYAQASKDGFNIFRHWFLWGSIEVAPGKFDFEDYDRQMELAEKYNIKTIIAELSHSIPEWIAARYPELLMEDKDGKKIYPERGVSCATGGFGTGLCLNKQAAIDLNTNFLTKLAERYKGHPALLGYDVQNECNYLHGVCHCPDTVKVYHKWLEKKYGNIETLNKVWNIHSYTSFSDIRLPVYQSMYPDSVDWLDFCRENFYDGMQYKIDTIRKVDADCLMTAHGVANTFRFYAYNGCDEWTSASKVESYGLTWVVARQGSEPWRQFSAEDLTRAGSRGKPFWHAEMQGGPLWLQPQTKGRPREDGRIGTAEEVRLWNLTAMACGASGIMYLRWRSLLDGPLFGAFGVYGMDGLPTDRSEVASSVAKWANEPKQKEMVHAKPIKDQVGILFVPECHTTSYLLSQFGDEHAHYRIMNGAYQGFFDNNIQANFVHIDDIGEYDTLYFPYPVSMTGEQAQKLKDWVHSGGTLISEACPGYFGDNLTVGTTQPNFGMDEMFGVKEKRVEFMPDILLDIPFTIMNLQVSGGCYLQTYECTTATALANYDNQVIAASNTYGKGKTMIIGAMLSERYGREHDEGTRLFFARLLKFAGKEPVYTLSDNQVRCRLHEGEGSDFLWLVNPTERDREVEVSFYDYRKLGEVLWHGGKVSEPGPNGQIRATVSAKNALVVSVK